MAIRSRDTVWLDREAHSQLGDVRSNSGGEDDRGTGHGNCGGAI